METSTLKTNGNYCNIFDYTIVSEVEITLENKVERVGALRVQLTTELGSLNFKVSENFISDYIGKEFTIEKFYMVKYENALNGSISYEEFIERNKLEDNVYAKEIHYEYKHTFKKLSRIFGDIYIID